MLKRILIIGGSVLVLAIGVTGYIFYPLIKNMTQIEVVQVDPMVTIVTGGGGNSGIIVGDSLVVVIDTKIMTNATKLYELVQLSAGTKPVIVINTHFHPDHTSGNKLYDGSRIISGNYDMAFLQKNIDAENQPNEFVKDSLSIDIGGETVVLYNLGQAHTMNDVVVLLKNHRMVFTGDLLVNKTNPVLQNESNANVTKWIPVLEQMISRWSDCRFVPGHGEVGDKETVASLHQYFVDMTVAAGDESKAKALKEKYKDWMELPFMASAERTVEFIKKAKSN